MKTKKWLRAEIKRLRAMLDAQTILYTFKFAQTAVQLSNGELEVIPPNTPYFNEYKLPHLKIMMQEQEKSLPELIETQKITHEIKNMYYKIPITHRGLETLYVDPLFKNEETK